MGLATGLPTVGVAKNLHLIEDLGLEGERGEAARRLKESFKGVQAVGHQLPLVTQKGRVLGAAVKTSLESKNPIFVSVGSGLSLKTAVSLVSKMSRYFLKHNCFVIYSFLWQTPDTRTDQTGRFPLKGIFEIKPPVLQV